MRKIFSREFFERKRGIKIIRAIFRTKTTKTIFFWTIIRRKTIGQNFSKGNFSIKNEKNYFFPENFSRKTMRKIFGSNFSSQNDGRNFLRAISYGTTINKFFVSNSLRGNDEKNVSGRFFDKKRGKKKFLGLFFKRKWEKSHPNISWICTKNPKYSISPDNTNGNHKNRSFSIITTRKIIDLVAHKSIRFPSLLASEKW